VVLALEQARALDPHVSQRCQLGGYSRQIAGGIAN
jgi:hypothetical protein